MADKVHRLKYVTFDSPCSEDTQLRVPKHFCGGMYSANNVDALHADIIDQGRKVLNATSEIGMSHAEYIEWVMERLEGNDSTLAAHPSPI